MFSYIPMLKGIIILTLAFYVFYKITSFFFRAGASSQQFRQQQSNRQFGKGPIDSDMMNSNGTKKTSKGNNAKGGEYIDYEEVK